MRYYIDSEHRAYLPIFRGLVRPEFIAEGGLVVQIPVKNSEVSQQQLRAEILKLSQEQGNEYLRELVERKDIDWQQIVLTQKDWDYKQQGLTPAGAAILAIAITIATSGAGSAISSSVSSSLTNTLGASTANAVGAMSSAAFTSLVSQAGIALVNNQGDIKKTLKQLGEKDSIKQLATSVVTAGLLNKIGGMQWASKFSGTGLDDRVIKAMIDSTARAVVETGINGGSLSENLERALKAGLLNAVHGELAENIKGLEDNYYVLHKLAHAAAGCAVGAVQKQCEAGAIGAAVGEMIIEPLLEKYKVQHGFYTVYVMTDEQRNKVLELAKLTSATVAAYAGYDVNIATQSSHTAVENNGFWAVIPAGLAIADKVYTAYQIYLDIEALKNGKTTWEKLEKEKGSDYMARAILGNVGKYGKGEGKLHIGGNELNRLILDIGYNKDSLMKAKLILEKSIAVRKAEKVRFGGVLDEGHRSRIKIEQNALERINNMLKEVD